MTGEMNPSIIDWEGRTHFLLTMNTVCLLWSSPVISRHSYMSVQDKVWFAQPSRDHLSQNIRTMEGAWTLSPFFRSSLLWYLLPTSLPSMSSCSLGACRSNSTCTLRGEGEEPLFLKLSSSFQVTLCHLQPRACS